MVPGMVFNRDGSTLTNSQEVAAFFGKLHKNVLQDIRGLIRDEPRLAGLNFQPGSRDDANGQSRPCYDMERTGLTLLAMGFTGMSP
jgi:Rha family phage regulatory protein